MLLACILFSSLNVAAEQQSVKAGKLTTNTDLHKQPKYQSDVLTQLLANENVNVARRHRAWYQVLTAQQQRGWVKMLNVRFVGVMKRQGELGVKSVFDSLTKQVTPTASTGIRGFDEEALKTAKADLEQLDLLASYQGNAKRAKDFARAGKIKSNLAISTAVTQN